MEMDKSTAKTINSLLNSPKTRIVGLKSLHSYLEECSDENFADFCLSWMQNCCKSEGSPQEIDSAVQILSKLFRISANHPELNKNVSFFISNRFFDHFLKYFVESYYGWECAKTCFTHYRGPSGQSLENIEKHLLNVMRIRKRISSNVADCMALLPSLGGGGNDGVNYKVNWKIQFGKYLSICHSILNDLLVGIDEMQEYHADSHMYESEQKHPSADNLAILLYNHSSVLNSMLLNSYPAPKCIAVDAILELVCRVLALNPSFSGEGTTSSAQELSKVLPDVQIIFLDLLNSLIVTCGNQLLPCSLLICKLIKQMLERTSQMNLVRTTGSHKKFARLRVAVYSVLCNWSVAAKSGSSLDSVSSSLIGHITSDIEFKSAVTLLKAEPKAKQNVSRQRSRLRFETDVNGCLCYSALKALQCLLRYSGVFLKSADHKHLQETVVKLLIIIYKSPSVDVIVPYTLSTCRRELFSALLELVNQPCSKWPPPTHFALHLFRHGANDSSTGVSQLCSSALNSLTVIIHQQFSNGPCVSPQEEGTQSRLVTNGLCAFSDTEPTVMSDSSTDGTTPKQNTSLEGESAVFENVMFKNGCSEIEGAENPTEESNINQKEKSLPEIIHQAEEIDVTDETSLDEPSMLEEIKCETKTSTEQNHCLGEKTAREETGVEALPPERIQENGVAVERRSDVKYEGVVGILEEVSRASPRKKNKFEETEEPSRKKPKMSQEESPKSPDSDKNSSLEPKKKLDEVSSDEKPSTPFKIASLRTTEESRSTTPDSLEESKNLDSKKRYFLRSKTGSLEESEEPMKRTESSHSLRHTPARSLGKNTPNPGSRTPRTRSSSKLEIADNEEVRKVKKVVKETNEMLGAFDEALLN